MLIDIIKSRHSIRKYLDQQISKEDIELILEAGSLAPNAGGGQRTILVGVRNKELTTKLGIMNLNKFQRNNLAGSYVSLQQPSSIDDPNIKNWFYGAPSVICIFGQTNFMFNEADAFCCGENMVLQATELGISSCIISRGKETFESEEGNRIMESWDIPKNYQAICFVILGYIDGDQPVRKELRKGRIKLIEEDI